MIHQIHNFDKFSKGTRVKIHSLKKRTDLNNKTGFIIKSYGDRIGIDVDGEKIRIMESNLEFDVVNGVRFNGHIASATMCKVSMNNSFIKVPIPHVLGIPLVAFLEKPSPNDGCSPSHAIFLMSDINKRFAPNEWQYSGDNKMPMMQLARTDGVDFTTEELCILVDYITDTCDRDDYKPSDFSRESYLNYVNERCDDN